MTAPANWLQTFIAKFCRLPENKTALVDLLRLLQKKNVLGSEPLAMIEGVLQVSELTVGQIMIPRGQMMSIAESETPEVFIPKITESGHSRFPVFDERGEQVKGVVLAKDLLSLIDQKKSKAAFDFDEYLRPVLFVPETKRLDSLLQEFKRTHQHMSVVVDEYGSVVGLVTIEDVLEQIVGDIDDEYDVDHTEQHDVQKQTNETFIVKARMSLEEFNAYFKTNFDIHTAATIGGFLLNQWHHVPRRNEHLQVGGLMFTVLKADHRRIQLLVVKRG